MISQATYNFHKRILHDVKDNKVAFNSQVQHISIGISIKLPEFRAQFVKLINTGLYFHRQKVLLYISSFAFADVYIVNIE